MMRGKREKWGRMKREKLGGGRDINREEQEIDEEERKRKEEGEKRRMKTKKKLKEGGSKRRRKGENKEFGKKNIEKLRTLKE